ncbi:restriction endonuclease subunit S [Staphylococcus pseudintermedius]|uniref:restriction endonuclease subunit S n=1 Tax=Staphylococcus pseudintermedius TaxID=283734 RepID=UPI00255270DA|nr:restriction endonuclease subunit S [Staphylococcus pseudintermedius]MDT0806406.1 restriction endonuclease subunit S [Staphylococcus pseudintermedius]MDT0956913.1 restriction endonuclease subunit S [Staphylococcus pseudintermedius]MDT0968990.1 restriction endonuclease subunit S [Staphylococcus pseudintermedius]MDT0985845.1 restriction endonuclease subunit S [Staphylococcus pseudintermedius]WIV34868.1 restriction endonuclease subunit S [Staphylococcus pseudintermedius]
MTEHKNTPELRFPEFKDEWIEYYLGNNAIIKGRLGWKGLKQSEYLNNGYAYLIANKHIKNGRITWEETDQINKFRYDESPEIALETGDLIFSKDGALGNPALIKNLPKPASINSTMMLVRLNKNNFIPNFFYQILLGPLFNKLIYLKVSGSSIPHLFQADMKDFKFKAPSLPEQEKIGNFFSKLDQQIELEEKKLELLEQQKRGYMQKLFSQELRFKDEIGKVYPKWNLKKLKDIANVYQPQNLSQNKFQEKGYPVYGANGVIGYYKEFNHSNMEIAIACRGNTCGRVNLTEPKSWITSNAMVVNIIDKKEIDFYFLYQYLRIINYNNVISGSGQPQITRKNMNSIELLVPKYVEQQKIGAFLTKYEELIKKQSSKVGLLKRRKQGLLQKMFV